MNVTLSALTAADLRRAAQIKDQIDALQEQLNEILVEHGGPEDRRPRRGGRKFSAGAIERISAAQKARWARARSASTSQPRRRMSAVARATIAAAARAR